MHKVFLKFAVVLLLISVALFVYETYEPDLKLNGADSRQTTGPDRSTKWVAMTSRLPAGFRTAQDQGKVSEFTRARRCAAGLTQYCFPVKQRVEGSEDSQSTRSGTAGRELGNYEMDPHSFDLAKRTAAIIGSKGKTSPQSLRFYRDVAERAEKGCRFRDPLACWHRAQLADYSRDRRSAQWLLKAKVVSGDLLKSCAKKSTPTCIRARTVQTRLGH